MIFPYKKYIMENIQNLAKKLLPVLSLFQANSPINIEENIK